MILDAPNQNNVRCSKFGAVVIWGVAKLNEWISPKELNLIVFWGSNDTKWKCKWGANELATQIRIIKRMVGSSTKNHPHLRRVMNWARTWWKVWKKKLIIIGARREGRWRFSEDLSPHAVYRERRADHFETILLCLRANVSQRKQSM